MIRITLLLAAVLLLPHLTGTAIAAEEPSRNVVFILIDDLGHRGVTAYGADKIGFVKGALEDIAYKTPNIDRLANEGIRCDRAFAYPLCEPTRIALMSGKYNSRNLLEKKPARLRHHLRRRLQTRGICHRHHRQVETIPRHPGNPCGTLSHGIRMGRVLLF